MLNFGPFIWPSEPPPDCPFPISGDWKGLHFLGRCSDYNIGDTIYPIWAADDALYTPFTEGEVGETFSCSSGYVQGGVATEASRFSGGFLTRRATTGHAVLRGSDPLDLRLEAIGTHQADPYPYGGRYPCGSLHHRGVWYYGTYCLSPFAETPYGKMLYNWPHLGPFVGFRLSLDSGQTWVDSPHTPARPLFEETGLCGYPVKIGAPHFVDFGKDMAHSPDGWASILGPGSDLNFYPPENFAHLSWISTDQVYLLRVLPTPGTINDAAAYDFFAGCDPSGEPRWTKTFGEIKPLLEWQNNMGCVTATYHPTLDRYLMLVTDGGNTVGRMNTYLLESKHLTGPWKLITYMINFGEQAYFVNIPSKFISPDRSSFWICYSGNLATDWNGEKIRVIPPGSRYGLVLQEVELV